MSITYESNRAVGLAETGRSMVDAAAAMTAGRLQLSSPLEVRRRLVRDDPTSVAAFRFELARQIAAALLWLDPYVRAVYEEQDVPPGEELAPDEPGLAEPLRLFVEVEVETPALHVLISGLNDALVSAMGGLLPEPPLGFIDATVLDERNHRLLQPRAHGYRPAPALLASRESIDRSDGV